MQQVSVKVYWSWNVPNDRGEPCLTIDDLAVHAHCKTDSTTVEDMNIEHIKGDFAERTGLAWVHHERELPEWLAKQALEAARKEIERSDSNLYELLVEAAQEEYYACKEGD